jgi:hypothetical protein
MSQRGEHLERFVMFAAARRRLTRLERAVDGPFDRHRSLELDAAVAWLEALPGAAA